MNPLLVLIGMCLFAAIDQLLMWRGTRRHVAHLWSCAWACLALIFMVGRFVQRLAVNEAAALMGGRLQIAAALAVGAGATASLRAITGRPEKGWYHQSVYASTLVLIGVTLFTPWIVSPPLDRYTDAVGVSFLAATHGPLAPLLLVFASGVVMLAIRQVREDTVIPEGARRIFAICIILLLLTIFNDVLQLMRVINTVSMVEYGLALMVLMLAHLVKRRIASVNDDVGRALAAVEHHKLELERAMAERDLMQAHLVRADRLASLGTLAAGTAHEINNPLTYILSNLDVVIDELRTSRLNENPTESSLDLLVEARGGCERVRRIVRQLETLSSAPTGESGSADLASTLDTTVNLIKNELRHRAELDIDITATDPVALDEGRLGQVFLNLLINAAHAVEESDAQRPLIRVVGRQEGGLVVVHVIDNGKGIPAEIVGRVFDPFFTTKADRRGTGLGLSVCHGVVTHAGGTIAIEKTDAHGTTIRVALPTTTTTASAPPKNPAAPPVVRSLDILVVDDEVIVAKALRRMLTDHNVTLAHTVRDALDACENERFDVIVCDLMMPQQTGMDLHATLARERPRLAQAMVFVSGGAFTTEARNFVEATTNPVLAKPLDRDTLMDAIATVRRGHLEQSGDEPARDPEGSSESRSKHQNRA